jgi:hypothetical protein
MLGRVCLVAVTLTSASFVHAAPVGFKGAAWGGNEASVIRLLKTNKKTPCRLPSNRLSPAAQRELGQPFYAIKHAVEDKFDASAPEALLLGRLLYDDKRKGIEDLFQVVPVATGCGLFVKHRYFGQLNVIKSPVDEKATLDELSTTLGSATRIGGESYYGSNYGGAHNVYQFKAGDSTVYFVYWSDRVATFYLSTAMLGQMNNFINDEIDQRNAKLKAEDDAARKANAKKAVKGL